MKFETTTLCTASQQTFYCLQASMNGNLILAVLKDQCTCDKFCCKSKKNAQTMHATKSGFAIIIQKWNSIPLTWIAYPLNTQRKWGKSGQTSRTCWWFFSIVRYCSSEIWSFRSKGLPAILLRKFAMFAKASLPCQEWPEWWFSKDWIEPFAARGLAVANRKFDSWQVVLELS